MGKLLVAMSFLFSLLFQRCSSEKGYVVSNVTGQPFTVDGEKNYKGYNPNSSNDTLYRRYERNDSLTTSEIYDNSVEREAKSDI